LKKETLYRRLLLVFLILFGTALNGFSQTLLATRTVNWTLAGLRDTTTSGFAIIDMQTYGAIGDGITPNDSVVSAVLSSVTGPGAILVFQSGDFLFNHTIVLPANTIIRGQGAANTIFTMSLGGTGYGISAQGTMNIADTTSLVQTAIKDSNFILVSDTTDFAIGDWIQIIELDTDLVTSSWAWNTVGQIVLIENIINHKIVLASPLRMDFDMARSPYIRKINPIKNVGIECLKILRTDNTAPEQSSNVLFRYAVNGWVNGIESENCTYGHIEAEYSSNLSISKSYIHHAFEYGDLGRGYGVILHFTTNECRVEDNVFEHLRHSMIVQAGANGNVFAYNYSFDPYWTTVPNNSSGDMVLHGNYVYANLFEQNICRNIVIDDSHGPNGFYNTFFRNRSEGYGIFFSAADSPNQNFVGNDIPNNTFPYNLVNYLILGSGHFLYGNNNKGTIDPAGTQFLPDSSYAYTHRPDFVPLAQWAAIGTPNVMGAASIPALDRYNSGDIFSSSCGNTVVAVHENAEVREDVLVFPNPASCFILVESTSDMKRMTITNEIGQVIYSAINPGMLCKIETKQWVDGIYFLFVRLSNDQTSVKKLIKIK
jgi:hypothetical protein